MQWSGRGPLRLGAMYAYVPDSAIVTRDGLNVCNVRARLHPAAAVPQAWVQGEAVWQRKEGVCADGWYTAPGSGCRQRYDRQGGSAQNWWILGTQLIVAY